jgi:uncharacterized MAPEG superfamily protein
MLLRICLLPPPFTANDPAASKNYLEGYARRAMLTMSNHAEQFPHFAVAALLNLVVRAGVATWPVAIMMTVIAVARGVHLLAYINDFELVRTPAFLVSGISTIVMYALVFTR